LRKIQIVRNPDRLRIWRRILHILIDSIIDMEKMSPYTMRELG
jgi:hypothetical protein